MVARGIEHSSCLSDSSGQAALRADRRSRAGAKLVLTPLPWGSKSNSSRVPLPYCGSGILPDGSAFPVLPLATLSVPFCTLLTNTDGYYRPVRRFFRKPVESFHNTIHNEVWK